MIGLGAKYLKAAGFGRYRITAASLGSLDLLGTWRWLNGVTQQAIMDAFGVDGTAVIAATNEYLNGIAASDRAKATALAGFINEDPMMVCSLGLEPQGVTMPIRWINNNATAYILTNITPASVNLYTDCTIKFNSFAGSTGFIIGTVNSSSWNGYSLLHYNGANMYMNWAGNDIGLGYRSVAGTVYSMQADRGKVTVNGVDRSTQRSGSYTYNYPMALFGRNVGGTVSGIVDMQASKFLFKDSVDGTILAHFIPCHDKTQGNGMLDLVNVVFYPNAGTGQFTIPDISYTPTP